MAAVRRPVRKPGGNTAAPKFKLNITGDKDLDVPIERQEVDEKKSGGGSGEVDHRSKFFVQLDDSMVSPVVASGHSFSFGAAASSSSSLSSAPPNHHNPPPSSDPLLRDPSDLLDSLKQPIPGDGCGGSEVGTNPSGRKFYKVQQSNLYVFVDGQPIVRKDGSWFGTQEGGLNGHSAGTADGCPQRASPNTTNPSFLKGRLATELLEQGPSPTSIRSKPPSSVNLVDLEATPDKLLPPYNNGTRRKRKQKTVGLLVEDEVRAQNSTHSPHVIALDELEIKQQLGAGQQGSVFACQHGETMYALKRINLADETDNELDRRARKASIVREVKVLENKIYQSDYLVRTYQAYFQKNQLLVLMEWMGINVEEMMKLASKMTSEDVRTIAQNAFGKANYRGNDRVKMTMVTRDASAKQQETAHVARSAALPEVVVAIILSDVLRGLDHLHVKMGVIHNDVKPANILLNTQETLCKLADFGCSMELGRDGKVHYSGVTLGTRSYMPPDRAQKLMESGPFAGPDLSSIIRSATTPFTTSGLDMNTENADNDSANGSGHMGDTQYSTDSWGRGMPRTTTCGMSGPQGVAEECFDEKSDIWSLGVVALELVNGCHPCAALIRDSYWNYANNLRTHLMIWPPRISNLLQDVIHRCLEVKPESRPSAADLLQMPFFIKYKDVDRRKLHEFLVKLRVAATEYETTKTRKAVEDAIQRSMNVKAVDYHEVKNRNTWQKWNSGLGGRPPAFDDANFPALV